MKSVLIVTHQHGFEADPIIDALREEGIGIFRFNCDSGDRIPAIAYHADERGVTVRFTCDDRSVAGAEIGAGWCQQLPPYFGQSATILECLQRESLTAAAFGAFEALDIPWFNRPAGIIQASNKALQLRLAQVVGLSIPKTLISNCAKEIREFAKNRTIIAKNIATPWIVSGQRNEAAYTRIVPPEWLADDDSLSFCPVIFQAFHERRRDYRVIIVDDAVFAAFCESNGEQREDVRRGVPTGENYEACTFDPRTTELLKKLMKRLGIAYCAADFIEDVYGNLFFLEVNTCGSWWWLNDTFRDEIRLAIVRSLKERLLGSL